MAVANGYGKVTTSGSAFMYDTGDTFNSYKGRPTTNLVGTGMSIYNNVPGSVSATLTETSETYKGAPVWIQTLTPTDASGVSWLSYGNNPGIGVVHGGGGGTANRYTGFSIYFKPTVPMNSVPIYLHYSNIPGWQSCCTPPEDMGDGWFRAKVLWYDTVTRSDGKYWAINPLLATLNTPITVYWAGPFKEDLNSQTISQYTPTSRSSTQGLLPIVGDSSINLSNVSFDSSAQMIFDGTDDKIDIAYYSPVNNSMSRTWEVIIKPTATMTYAGIFGNKLGYGCSYYCNGGIYLWDGNWVFNWYDNSNYQFLYSGISPTANQYFHIVGTYDATDQKPRIYINGELKATYGSATNMDYGSQTYVIDIGWNSKDGGQHYFQGQIPITKYYQNKALSPSEVTQNYNKYKTRFNLP
jgi:hypothetical protein